MALKARMMNSDVFYCESVIQNTRYSNFVYELKHFLDKDYRGKTFGFSEETLKTKGIDMDMVEASSSGDNEKTMDFVIGIAGRNLNNKRLLLVELKLGCGSIKSFKKDSYLKKDEHTRTLLRQTNFQIDDKSIFVFSEKVASVFKNHIARLGRGSDFRKMKHWVVLKPSEYNEYIKFQR